MNPLYLGNELTFSFFLRTHVYTIWPKIFEMCENTSSIRD